MTESQPVSDSADMCPNCGAAVVYGGIGRRPIWCSTRCRNDASLKRLAARRAGVEVRIVEVFRQRSGETSTAVLAPSSSVEPGAEASVGGSAVAPSPSVEQALWVIRNNPEAVARLMSHLERRRVDGALMTPDWLPVRNAIRLLARALPEGIERPG